MNIRWYLKRLSVMSPQEVLYRLKERGELHRLKVEDRAGGHAWKHSAVIPAFCSAAQPQLPGLPWDFGGSVDSDRVIAGEWPALGFSWRWSSNPDIWRYAPDTGRLWPMKFFGSIPFRSGNPVGDIRIAWEPARLQQLIHLAWLGTAGASPGRESAIDLLERQFLSWIELNPPFKGIHYISAMECALRILSVLHAFDLVRGKLRHADQVWDGVIRLVSSHAYLIQRRLSLHSSAGNHTIAEATGLIYSGLLFPELPEAEQWVESGKHLLEQEAARQILADGSGFEQSFWYLLLITDLLGLSIELLRAKGHVPAKSIVAAFTRGKQFLNALAPSPDGLPRVGDSDDGYALSPALRLSWKPGVARPARRVFQQGGYTLIRCKSNPPVEVLFDHGPLGMPPSYGHGHSDALSLLLRVGRDEVLVETGTYSYTGDPVRRAYFRSTRAHNTITVDGRDQAQQETAFMWSQPYHCELILEETIQSGITRLVGVHDGYATHGVLHFRGVILTPTGQILVWDHLSGRGMHSVEINWHIGVPIERDRDHGFILRCREIPVFLDMGGALEVTTLNAPLDSMQGWRSPSYGKLIPITTVRASVDASTPLEFTTTFSMGERQCGAHLSEHIEEFKRITGAYCKYDRKLKL